MKTAKYHRVIRIEAPAEVVFRALTKSTDIQAWYGSIAQLALRPGGHFTYADFTGDVYESGEFLEVKANALLRYTMEHHGFYRGSEVTIALAEPSSQSTELEVTHANLSESDLGHAGVNWDLALNNLKTYLETGTTQTFKAWFKSRR